MLKKILIANRGEIAVRVIRGCHDLGITSVAVYSELDADAVHTRLADEAYLIGPGPATGSYLSIPAILEAARRSGAGAVHPGYGFLAENADFARAVIDAGLVWVGPSPEVIAAMGDKTAARAAAADAGVATVPGTAEPVTESEAVVRFARQHGVPVAIKAAAGGGGKGFRVVERSEDFAEALSGAAREAQTYFGSADVYLERYLPRPRHVEVQVVGDVTGTIVSFPERDCSLQRRHQKLIEESPSPSLTERIREQMMAAAIKVSKQVGYCNAGTCEFLLDADGVTFYFLEMNTRLQVEHPVTEMVTGIDLVRAQLLIAAGEGIEFSQSNIELKGHAIECRINAEDPARNFMPAPGRITAYSEPGGPGVRVDSGALAGTTVPQAYDPLVAKVIVYGASREEARLRMLRALGEYTVGGIQTSIPFHQVMLADERFRSGGYHTGTVENEMSLSHEAGPPPTADDAGMIQRRWTVEVDGKRFEVSARERIGGRRTTKPKPPSVGSVGRGGSEVLSAPMQGTVLKLLVQPGDEIVAGDPVCVLEAMKMENSILAHTSGSIEEVAVQPGESVESGATIAIIR